MKSTSTDIMELTRRRATAADVPWLLELRMRTMNEHLAASGTSLSEQGHLDRLMHRYECAELLLHAGAPVGLLKVARDSLEWKIVQIQIAPELQGRGIGGEVLRQLIAQASAANVALTLSVLKANPARSLYERLGFSITGEGDHEYEMRRA